MLKSRLIGSIICVYVAMLAGAPGVRAAGCEDTIARHMVGEAMLAAQFVAAAEKNGVTTEGSTGFSRTLPPNPPLRNSGLPILPATPI